jgi:hypothetical protein
MGDLGAARAWALERCGPLAAELKNVNVERGPNYAALWHALRIRRVDGTGGNPWSYQISEEAADYLVQWAFASSDAFDVAKDIASQIVFAGAQLPTGLRRFVCRAIVDPKFRRPRAPGRSRDKNWLRDRLLLEILQELEARFDVRPMRNDGSKHRDSACDLVAQAFCTAGNHTLSYKILKLTWLNKTLHDEIALIQHLHATRDEEELPDFIKQGLPPFPVSDK